MPMHNFLKKAVALLVTTTFIIAPMQAFAQVQDKTFYSTYSNFEVPVNGNAVESTANILALIQLVDPKVESVLQTEIKSINGEDILFAQVKEAGSNNTPTKVYVSDASAGLRGTFAGGTRDVSQVSGDFDEATIVAPSWVNTSDITGTRARYNEVTHNGIEGFTVKTHNFGWYFVAKKKEANSNSNSNSNSTTPTTTTPTTSTIQSEKFYTSGDVEFPVVMTNPTTVDIAASKALLKKALEANEITGDENKKLAQEFLDYTGAEAVIFEIPETHNGSATQKKLFLRTNEHTTKVFHTEKATSLKDSFKHSAATEGKPADVDFDSQFIPSWITDKEDVTYYNKTENGYTILTKNGHWYYAGKKAVTTTPFYTSNKTPFPVVLKNETTVDITATKKALEALPNKLNDEDKKLAEAFKTLSEDEMAKRVEIKVIEKETVMFVRSDDNTTKVFHKNATSHLLGKFGNKKAGSKEGTPADVDLSNTVAPTWADTKDTITFYHETKEGYTLLNETGHWFYAKKKVEEPKRTTGGGGGYSSPSTPVVTTPSTPTTTPTTEVKGDEVVREKTPVFPNFSKKCTQIIQNLTDVRLTAYYDILNVTNRNNLNRELTRAEFLKLVLNSANIDVSNEGNTTYSDVSADHTLAKYIAYATRTGLVSGHNGKFRPNDTISRAEAAKIFVNAANLTLSTEINTFSDVDANNSLAKYIQTAYDNCLLHGRKTLDGNPINPPRVYEPNSPITLAETAKVLYNIVHQ